MRRKGNKAGAVILREGDIVLVRARTWLRPFAEFEHTALLWRRKDADWEAWLTVEAGIFEGVAAHVIGHWHKPFIVVRPIGATIAQGRAAADVALMRLGEDYGLCKLLKNIIRELKKRLRRTLRTLGVPSEPEICSTLATWAWRWGASRDVTPGIANPLPDEIAAGRVEVVAEFGGTTRG